MEYGIVRIGIFVAEEKPEFPEYLNEVKQKLQGSAWLA
jgi:hypothetical protein